MVTQAPSVIRPARGRQGQTGHQQKPMKLPIHKLGARAILTDLYQITMAYGYWKTGMGDREAVFHLFFRTPPFRGGFTVCCGLADAVRYLRKFKFDRTDLEYLRGLKGNDGKRLFDPAFLE